MKQVLFLSFSLLVTGALAQVPGGVASFLNSDDLDKCEAKYAVNGLSLDKIQIIKDSKISQRAYCVSFLPQLKNVLSKNQRVFRLLTTGPFPAILVVNDENRFFYNEREAILNISSTIDANIISQVVALEKKIEKETPFFLDFQGIAKDVKISALGSWTQCHKSAYNKKGISLSQIKADCSGTKVLLACATKGSSILRIAAMGDTVEVLRDVGSGRNAVNNHNGVDFYFSEESSMGFSPAGLGVNRSSCDTASSNGQDRMCWHTNGGSLIGGYRCGESTGLDDNDNFERLIFTVN